MNGLSTQVQLMQSNNYTVNLSMEGVGLYSSALLTPTYWNRS